MPQPAIALSLQCILIKKAGHIILSAWLSILLLFGSTSKEFVHLFTGHEDTVHCNNSHTDGLVIEPEHHHCTFLSFSLAAFNTPVFGVVTYSPQAVYYEYPAEVVKHLTARAVITPALRGPPAISLS